MRVLARVSFAKHTYKGEQIAVPDVASLRGRCIEVCHIPVYCGHNGGDRTYHNVKELFWWPGLKDAALQFVKNCSVCQANKHSKSSPVGALKATASANVQMGISQYGLHLLHCAVA